MNSYTVTAGEPREKVYDTIFPFGIMLGTSQQLILEGLPNDNLHLI